MYDCMIVRLYDCMVVWLYGCMVVPPGAGAGAGAGAAEQAVPGTSAAEAADSDVAVAAAAAAAVAITASDADDDADDDDDDDDDWKAPGRRRPFKLTSHALCWGLSSLSWGWRTHTVLSVLNPSIRTCVQLKLLRPGCAWGEPGVGGRARVVHRIDSNTGSCGL